MTASATPQKKSDASHMVSARLTKRQWQRVEHAIRASGLSRSEYLRRALLQRAIVFRPFEPLLAEALALALQCKGIGGLSAPDLRRAVAELDVLVERLSRLAGVELR